MEMDVRFLNQHGASEETDIHDRRFLDHFSWSRRSAVERNFRMAVRDGIETPEAVVAAVSKWWETRREWAVFRGNSDVENRVRWYLDRLARFPDEALALAAWALRFSTLSSEEQARRAASYREARRPM